MFANLESFSIFFFISLALIIIGIAFEDKLVALEKKHSKKRAAARKSNAVGTRKPSDNQKQRQNNSSIRSYTAPNRKGRSFAA